MLRFNREIRKAFQVHFCDCFARLLDIPLQEFRTYLADFSSLLKITGLVTKREVRDALKQVGFNKSPVFDGLAYEVYLRMSHTFVPILTDVFNRWFAQGAISTSITTEVITLLKKRDKHVCED